MLAHADAALIIGDPALLLDSERLGVLTVDLGHEWRELSGRPFVYAMWCGQTGACEPAHVAALNAARDAGVRDIDAIAREQGAGDSAREALVRRYLRDNLRYDLDATACDGLRLFHELAVEQGLAATLRQVRFFP